MNKKIIIILLGIFCVAGGYFYFDYENKKFELIIFDVGQGDSIFVNFPGNNEILIDGGKGKVVLKKLAKYMPIYDRSLEMVVLTHPHADHAEGLIEVLKKYEVKEVLYNDVKYDSSVYGEFLRQIETIDKIEDDNFDYKNFGDFEIRKVFSKEDIEDVNETSIVLKIILPNKESMFLTGDIGIETEEEILQNSPEVLKSDILKVGHQGSVYSSGERFLEKVLPKWAVISVGENSYGHPSLRIIKRLERLGVRVLRTDKDGDVRFGIDKDSKLFLKK
jgi:competence protein ComEC